MSSASTILRFDGLTKHFAEEDTLLRRLRPDKAVKTVRAVDDVDLSIEAGETLGLVGESGCGKSTLARTALRLIEPTSGQVYFGDDEVTAYDSAELRQFRSDVQMIFQDPFASLNPRYTVRRTLIEPMAVHDVGDSKADRVERAKDLIVRVGLGEDHLDRHPHEFSGGQRQRVSIARALAVEPDVVVADEPVSALDVSVQAQILNLLDSLRDEMGLSMLFISHDLSVIRRIADRVAVMYLGKIVERGPTSGVFETPRHPYTQALLSSIPVPDPTVTRDRIELTGDVPTPIDPPSGCRFHPRCPKVIPPDDWTGEQAAWRRILRFRKHLSDGEIDPAAVRDQLEAETPGAVADDDVEDAVYDEFIASAPIGDDEDVRIPDDAAATVRSAISTLVDGDRREAQTQLEDSFPTVCESTAPERLTVDSDRSVLCHLYDPSKPGTPDAEAEQVDVDGV